MTKFKKIFKSIVTGALISACIFTLCACGGTDGDKDDNKKPTGDDNPPVVTPDDKDNPSGTPSTKKDYIMEAENIELGFVQGGATSGSPNGSDLVQEDASAHGGKFISYLYVDQLYIEFAFTADKADDNATLAFCFGGENFGFSPTITFDNDELQIYVNPDLNDDYYPTDPDQRIKYEEFSVKGEYGVYKEVTITTNMKIKQGENIVYLLVNNTDSLFPSSSTMNAKAPTIDYMKISSASTLTHTTFTNN